MHHFFRFYLQSPKLSTHPLLLEGCKDSVCPRKLSRAPTAYSAGFLVHLNVNFGTGDSVNAAIQSGISEIQKTNRYMMETAVWFEGGKNQ